MSVVVPEITVFPRASVRVLPDSDTVFPWGSVSEAKFVNTFPFGAMADQVAVPVEFVEPPMAHPSEPGVDAIKAWLHPVRVS